MDGGQPTDGRRLVVLMVLITIVVIVAFGGAGFCAGLLHKL